MTTILPAGVKATTGGRFDRDEHLLYFLATNPDLLLRTNYPQVLVAVNELNSKKSLDQFDRLLDNNKHYAARPQVQERLTGQITAALEEHLRPLGAACLIRSTHSCMSLRGVKANGASMTTSSLTGIFRMGEARNEFLTITGRR